jgi:hypothetical protein
MCVLIPSELTYVAGLWINLFVLMNYDLKIYLHIIMFCNSGFSLIQTVPSSKILVWISEALLYFDFRKTGTGVE